jgi:DNA repair exonuclease SbcCD ATPase subunit
MHTIAEHATRTVASLTWRLPSGDAEFLEIHEGESLTIGSGSDADIELADPDVSAKHCLLWADADSLTVRDCYSSSGTHVNGQRIAETVLADNAELRIGEALLKLTFAGGTGNRTAVPDEVDQFIRPGDAELTPAELQFHLAQARKENDALRQQLASGVRNEDPFQQEMVELLRAEVVELQAALAERDGAEVAPTREERTDEDELPTRDEVERLAARLEQLLEELDERDERVALLNELLRAAEEATQAEQEERRQLDGWINEIEERISQREREREAEIDQLKARIAELSAERDRAESALAEGHDNARVEALQKLAHNLRDEVARLTNAFQESENQRRELQRHLDEMRIAAREEAVQLSRERADLARLRHELESKRTETQPSPAPTDPDNRVREVQQDLRDLHRQQRQEQQQRSLSSRLRKLWNRLE